MPWVGNIAKTTMSNGKQFTVTCKMLTAVARDQRWPDVVTWISARFSTSAFVLFCYITNHVMTGPLGNSEYCFPQISMFPSTLSQETLRFSGNKIHCCPHDQSLSVKSWDWIKKSHLQQNSHQVEPYTHINLWITFLMVTIASRLFACGQVYLYSQ